MNSISQKNLELFSKLSGDFNPLHLDQEFAKILIMAIKLSMEFIKFF